MKIENVEKVARLVKDLNQAKRNIAELEELKTKCIFNHAKVTLTVSTRIEPRGSQWDSKTLGIPDQLGALVLEMVLQEEKEHLIEIEKEISIL